MPHTVPHSRQPNSRPSGQTARLSVAPDALFVYGTLQFPEVLFTLIDRVPEHQPATAPGWRVTALPERVYPGLLRAPSTASGYLLTTLTPQEWRLLDTFEDPLYELRQLRLDNDARGWAYVCPPGTDVLNQDWSPTDFEQRHLPAYINRCAAWRQRYEANQQAG